MISLLCLEVELMICFLLLVSVLGFNFSDLEIVERVLVGLESMKISVLTCLKHHLLVSQHLVEDQKLAKFFRLACFKLQQAT